MPPRTNTETRVNNDVGLANRRYEESVGKEGVALAAAREDLPRHLPTTNMVSNFLESQHPSFPYFLIITSASTSHHYQLFKMANGPQYDVDCDHISAVSSNLSAQHYRRSEYCILINSSGIHIIGMNSFTEMISRHEYNRLEDLREITVHTNYAYPVPKTTTISTSLIITGYSLSILSTMWMFQRAYCLGNFLVTAYLLSSSFVTYFSAMRYLKPSRPTVTTSEERWDMVIHGVVLIMGILVGTIVMGIENQTCRL